MIVTAFGPFGAFKKNPSEVLGRMIFGSDIVVIPVTFQAVDEFVANLPETNDKLLMLGVAGRAKQMRFERVGTDAVGELADASGQSRPRESTDRLIGTLFENTAPCDFWVESENAGDYLCNYLYYEVTKKRPSIRSGFVHVPPFTAVPLPLQAVRLRRLISTL